MLLSGYILAQENKVDSTFITWSAFLDTYYSYDFHKLQDHQKPSFLYNHNRHNEINVNLALIKAAYNSKKIRTAIGLMAGTYPQYNLATEPVLLRHVYEANAGIRISNTKDLWIDVGIFPSHIGFESAISKDCQTLTRSILAENSPYYETGLKLTYTTANDKILLSGLILNGWQRIQRPYGNNTPAFGTQLTFKSGTNTILNWSTFIGNDKPDSVKQMRYFNNFYGIFSLNQVKVTVGFDVGWQRRIKSKSYHEWFSPILILSYSPNEKCAFAIRGEYYSDADGVIITTGTKNGFKTFGTSFNIDKLINKNCWWRSELRMLKSKDAIFAKEDFSSNNHSAVTTSLSISF
jgi:hypothetical protein